MDEAAQHGIKCQRPVLDGGINSREFLHHDAAGADIEVADLGIAHLPGRQADDAAGGGEKGARGAGPEPVEIWLARLRDGVVRGVLAPAETVENHEHYGFRGHRVSSRPGMRVY